MAYYTAGIVGPYVRNALTPSTFDISGGNISNSGTTTSANATISGRIQTPGSLDISAGTLSNSVRILTGSGTAAAPSYTFGTDASMGLYDPATNVLGFATSGLERMRIASDGNVGVGKTPTTALDVSGTMQTTNAIISGRIRDASGTLDISGGNITVSGVITAGAVATSGIAPTNIVVPGYIWNAIPATTLNISGGNISNSGTTTSSNFFGTSATSNNIGGVTFENYAITTTAASSNRIGGVTLSNYAITTTAGSSNNIGGVTLSGNTITTNDNTSNRIGGVTLSSSNISNDATSSNTIGGVTLSNTSITLTGTITGSTATVSNQIGGVTLQSNNISLYGTITGNDPTTSNQIGGVTLSNYSISNSFATSNQIGGITLSNSNISLYGTITGNDINSSNQLGGVTLQGTNITLDGTITGNVANTSNTIGGITLSNQSLGVGISNPTVQLDVAGLVRVRNAFGEANITMISGVGADATGFRMYQLSSEQGIYTSNTAPFHIYTMGARRITALSNGNVGINNATPGYTLDVNGTTQTTNALVPGYLRNDQVATQFDISGGNIRNVGTLQTGTGFTVAIDASDSINSFKNVRAHLGAFVGVDESEYLGNGVEYPLIYSHTFQNGMWTYKTVSDTGGLLFKTRIAGVTAERMRIGSNGFLGIGNSAPLYPLSFPSTTGTKISLFESSGGTLGFGVFASEFRTSADAAATATTWGHYTGATFTERMRLINSNGNVGIGAAVLSNYRMTIRGTGTNTGTIAFHKNATNVPYVGMGYDQTVDASDGLAFFTNNGVADLNGTAMFIMRTNRRVGIGTTVPTELLDVVGGSIQTNAQLMFNSADTEKIYLTNFDTSGSKITHSTGWSVDIHGGTNTAASGNIRMMRGIVGGYAETARFDSNGRMGIGQAAPAYTLDVCAGSTVASINMSTWPRFAGSTIYTGTYLSRNTDVINWTTVTAIDTTNLMSVITGSGFGTYYIIKKSGIWNIQFRTTGPSANNWNYGISFSNTTTWVNGNFSSNLIVPVGLGNNEGGAFAAFTGYLPSNATTTYKAWVTAGNTPSAGSIVITFLGEIPTTFANPL